ncbi:MAG: hypothetical protein CM1200mP20_09040 [Pseudomonadota bacterium]|nr:MAG: hypothetical protein CM1200mP20_09040 [Pseudomonadota bacterium]
MEQRAAAESIIQSVGTSIWVRDETLIDTVTAVSGSGPAYFFYLMEAMIEAGVAGGLEPSAARALWAFRQLLAQADSPSHRTNHPLNFEDA